MISVSIIGITGYTALELLRLLVQHPQFVVKSVTARSAVGMRLDEIYPQLRAVAYNETTPAVNPALIVTEEPARTDLAFVCLPHAAAAESVVKLVEQGSKVVDLSADFRLRDVKTYEKWYNHTHPAPALLETAVYGLCERYRDKIQGATLVANPGCHVTTSLLALLPAVQAGIIEPDIIIDTKTGVSGAGRTPKLTSLYAEVSEDVQAYSLAGHRHLPEITQELEAAATASGHETATGLRVTFIPHLIPMTRGLLATCYANLKQEMTAIPTNEDVYDLYKRYYTNEPFVHVVKEPPHTKWTYGTNHCFVYPIVDVRTKRFIVISCLDNLVKGASGQAIQNANRLYGLPESTGLASIGVNP